MESSSSESSLNREWISTPLLLHDSTSTFPSLLSSSHTASATQLLRKRAKRSPPPQQQQPPPPPHYHQFESANFDPWDSAIYEAEIASDTTLGKWTRPFSRWLMLFTIGITVGSLAALVAWTSRFLIAVKFSAISTFLPQPRSTSSNTTSPNTTEYSPSSSSYYNTYSSSSSSPSQPLPPAPDTLPTAFLLFVCISVLYAALASLPAAFIEPTSAGSGIPEVKAILNGVVLPRVLRVRTLVCKIGGLIFSVAAGLPVGKEGPMVHSGAVVASAIASGKKTLFSYDTSWSVQKRYRNDKERRDLVACGAAAGVAAAFAAPVGGVLFAIEDGATFWNRDLTWRSFFCAIVAAYTIDFFLSGIGVPGSSGNATTTRWGDLGLGMFTFGSFSDSSGNSATSSSSSSSSSWSAWEIPLFVIVGLLGGLVGTVFVSLNKYISLKRFQYIPITSPRRRFIEVLVVACINAILKFGLSLALGECRKLPASGTAGAIYASSLVPLYCPSGEYNEMASLFMAPSEDAIRVLFHFNAENSFSFAQLSVFFLVYTLMAAVTYGIAVPSGLFIPSLLAGSALGRFVGEGVNAIAVGAGGAAVVDAGTYALVGAAAVLGGNTRMTISLAVIVLECTGNYQFALPLMIVLYMARFIGNLFTEGIYDLHIHLRGWPVLEDRLPRLTVIDTFSGGNGNGSDDATRSDEIEKKKKNDNRSSVNNNDDSPIRSDTDDDDHHHPLSATPPSLPPTPTSVKMRMGYALRAGDIMTGHPAHGALNNNRLLVVEEVIEAKILLSILRSCSHNGFPVVYCPQTIEQHPRLGSLAGLIERKQLLTLLAKGAFHTHLPEIPFLLGSSSSGSGASPKSPSVSKTTQQQQEEEGKGATIAAYTLAIKGERDDNKARGSGDRSRGDRGTTPVRVRLPTVPHLNVDAYFTHKNNHDTMNQTSASYSPRSAAVETMMRTVLPDETVVEFVYESEPLLRYDDFEGQYPRYPELTSIHLDDDHENKQEIGDHEDGENNTSNTPLTTTFTSNSTYYVDLRPYMNPTPFTVHVHAPLERAYTLFRQHGLRHLLVVNDCGDVVGIITRADLLPTVLHERVQQRYARRGKLAEGWIQRQMAESENNE